MTINLTPAQHAITAVFQTNPAVVFRPSLVNTNGTVERTYTQVVSTTCHAIHPRSLAYAPVNDTELGTPPTLYLSFPYATNIAQDDVVQALGRFWHVVTIPVNPQFALDTLVGVVAHAKVVV